MSDQPKPTTAWEDGRSYQKQLDQLAAERSKSDQPKPSTGNIINERLFVPHETEPEPKPATGEWTTATVRNIAGRQLRSASGDDLVADAHNAALADEVKKREGIEQRLGVAFDRMVHDYQQQLADEREAREDEGKLIRTLSDDVMQLSEQLAAERVRQFMSDHQPVEELEQQLAAEREKVK